LLFGAKLPIPGSFQGGRGHLIATQPLVDFREANRRNHDGVITDLPSGRTILKRMRRRLGFNCFEEIPELWQGRIEDLDTLSAREFALRHNVDVQVVFDTRRKLLGTVTRDPDWWRKARPLKVLRSNIQLREVGRKLGISISHAERLRDRAIVEK
jgi:hypothetical protein